MQKWRVCHVGPHDTGQRCCQSSFLGSCGGAGSLSSLLQTGLVESDDSATVTDLDAAFMRSAVSFTSQTSYDHQRFGWQVTLVSSYVPFPPRRSGEYPSQKGMIPARPLYQGVRGSVWDPEPSRERVGDWGGPERSWPPCVLPTGVPQDQTDSGGIYSPPMLGHERPGEVSPARGVVLTDLQSSIDCQ